MNRARHKEPRTITRYLGNRETHFECRDKVEQSGATVHFVTRSGAVRLGSGLMRPGAMIRTAIVLRRVDSLDQKGGSSRALGFEALRFEALRFEALRFEASRFSEGTL